MTHYLIRRTLYALLILIGVNVLTFALFFAVNTPDDVARMQIGGKRVTQEAIDEWKMQHGYDKPLLWNSQADGMRQATDTIFYERSVQLFAFRFGASDTGRDIGYEIRQRAGPSLALAVPTFVLGLFVCIVFSMTLVFFRATYLDFWGVVVAVIMMSIPSLFYIVVGQFIFSKTLNLVPISGFQPGADAFKFLILPVVIGVVYGLGGASRLYRTFFLEEVGRDYVRTARSKGLSEQAVLFRHVLRNALIPILTGSVAAIPLLFMGSLLLETFFSIPGLGSYTIDAIQAQDFAVVRSMVFLGSLMTIIGYMLTDIAYTLADPRIRLE